uniref:ribonuclease H n=1 Tax=Gasterosteus aculeatus aculeatus TaxID=481459 RepID=A0AAQ4P6T0_GASAC
MKLNRLKVLCECRGKVDLTTVPLELLPEGTTENWRIIIAAESPVENVSPSPLKRLLEDQPADGSAESIIRAVGDLLAKMEKPSGENSSYRRLRVFSGTVPTPSGEESLEHWLEHAHLMVEESECSAKEKRRRIMECLKGPALAVVKAVRTADPEVSPARCLEAIESAFGSAETGEDLYFAFRLLQQQPKERLSDFLRRLELSLTKVVRRGGLPPGRVDHARVEQLLRGAVHSDMMLVQLKLRERKADPPTFLELLSDIRNEEEYESSRKKLHTSIQGVHAWPAIDSRQEEVEHLRSEVKELKSMFTAMRSLSSHPVAYSKEHASLPKVLRPETGSEEEVAALRKQVKNLQEQIAGQPPKVSESAASALRVEPSRQPSFKCDENFCYRCGENGHFSAKCHNAENQAKVIQKLIQSLKKAKQGESSAQATGSSHTVCSAKKSEITILQGDIPQGLIGPSSIVPVKINGQQCNALLDSGSQVTIIFESWYKRHLPNVAIQPVSGLAIWGLSENSYPYLGYVVVDMAFPEKVTGTKEPLSVLALICPSPSSPEQTPVILGTNANLFQRLSRLCKETTGVDIAQTLGIKARDPVVHTDQSTAEGEEDEVGCVKWMGPCSLILPPAECCVSCDVELKQPLKKDMLMVEASPTAPLPAGVLLQPMVIQSAAVEEGHFTVLIMNESRKDIVIPVGIVLGQLCHADPVVPSPKAGAETVPTKLDPELLQFGDSPIPHQWKERLRQKLCERAEVFSLHEWDVGLAKDVEHNIRMTDPKPFRERSRRLAPADIDDVHKHLQELLNAGIITESRSQYASPIVIARKKNGRIRMCIDYRTLNRRTIPDQYTTPRIDDALDCLTGSKGFSVLDLRSGYYQIAMADEDKEKTAFICPLGFFQFDRMPQGITGAPATFQRLMEKAVGDMNLQQVLVYLDNLIVFGRSLEEHEARLLRVLDRLEEVGLKLSLDKCQFCQPRVKYVGHIVSADGVATDPEKIEAVTRWPKPTDLKSLRSFLGFCGYYRRFIANYSSIVRPLTELTKGYAPNQPGKKQVMDKTKTYFKASEPFNDRWDQSCTDAFNRIIQCLINAPVLAFADANKPYVLHTDASFKGIGAVLYQEHPEGLRPVAFAS